MNLQPVTMRQGQRLLCCSCGKWAAGNDGPVFADLDGEAFKSYYCAPCAAKLTGETSCS